MDARDLLLRIRHLPPNSAVARLLSDSISALTDWLAQAAASMTAVEPVASARPTAEEWRRFLSDADEDW